MDSLTEFVDSVMKRLVEAGPMIKLDDKHMIDPSEIAGISVNIHRAPGSQTEGAIDMRLFLKGGNVIDVPSMSRDQIDSFEKAVRQAAIKTKHAGKAK